MIHESERLKKNHTRDFEKVWYGLGQIVKIVKFFYEKSVAMSR